MSRPPVPINCCEGCGDPSILQDWAAAFNVQLCRLCRRQEQLISKSNAKATYLLSDADISKLGSLQMTNMHHKEFAPMKMYLVRQVEQVAVSKHGSLDELAEEKQRRVRGKIETKARRRQREELLQEKQQEYQAALQAAIDKHTASKSQQHHPNNQQQEELEEVVVDPVTNKRHKRVAPEFAAAEVEEI